MRALVKIMFQRVSEMKAVVKAPTTPKQTLSKFSLFKKSKPKQIESPEPLVVPNRPQQRLNKNGELEIVITFIGESGTGAKTSFVNRYVHGTFLMNVETTIGAKFVTKEVVSRGVTVHLMMWDTAGQERYISLTPAYLMNCSGAVVGYDITSKGSLITARDRHSDLKTKYPNAVIMVIGNKADLECDRRVSLEEGEALANTLHASLFFESKKILLHSFLLVFSH